MSEFIRENRYIVIKRSDLDKLYKDPTKYATTFGHAFSLIAPHLPKRKFLVIESDWPEYEPAWQMIERRVSGLPDELTAAQSELAALREELAASQSIVRAQRVSLDNCVLRYEAAEQRNAELEQKNEYLTGLICGCDRCGGWADDKPTESGASE